MIKYSAHQDSQQEYSSYMMKPTTWQTQDGKDLDSKLTTYDNSREPTYIPSASDVSVIACQSELSIPKSKSKSVLISELRNQVNKYLEKFRVKKEGSRHQKNIGDFKDKHRRLARTSSKLLCLTKSNLRKLDKLNCDATKAENIRPR